MTVSALRSEMATEGVVCIGKCRAVATHHRFIVPTPENVENNRIGFLGHMGRYYHRRGPLDYL